MPSVHMELCRESNELWQSSGLGNADLTPLLPTSGVR